MNSSGEPRPIHLLMRAVIALAAFGVGMSLIWYKVFRPAIKAEEAEVRQQQDEGA